MRKFLQDNQAALIVGTSGSLLSAAILAALKVLLGAVEGLGTVIATVAPWLFIGVAALLFGSALAFTVAKFQGARGLRSEVFWRTKEMRQFADEAEKNPKRHELPKSFWDKFPFESYQALEDRMGVNPGVLGAIRVVQFYPNAPSVIRHLASELERQAVLTPTDMLL